MILNPRDIPDVLRVQDVVVGSGPGGAITACMLAEAGKDVLLIEEGRYFSNNDCAPFSLKEMLLKYRNGGITPAFGRTKVAYVEGKCVGGGSEVNSGLYHRTPPEILERWQKEFGVEGITEAEMKPHFERVEKDLSVSLSPNAHPPSSLKLHEGAQKQGWKSMEIPRWQKYEASGGSTRQTMSCTYIPRALGAGCRLLPETKIVRFRQDGEKWTLLGKVSGRKSIQIQAGRVFLCAGAIQTPALLRRSGITRNIGNSLRLHPTIKIAARFSDPVNSMDAGVPMHQVKEFSPELSFGCSISNPSYLALALLDQPECLQSLQEEWRHMAVYYAMTASESIGSIRALYGIPEPIVRYKITNQDLQTLSKGIYKLGHALFAAGATRLNFGIGNFPAIDSADKLSRIPTVLPASRLSLMTIHLFSSCPMGENKKICATDSHGKLHGMKNLYINDASLLCTAPGVNPQGTIMAIAGKNMAHHV